MGSEKNFFQTKSLIEMFYDRNPTQFDYYPQNFIRVCLFTARHFLETLLNFQSSDLADSSATCGYTKTSYALSMAAKLVPLGFHFILFTCRSSKIFYGWLFLEEDDCRAADYIALGWFFFEADRLLVFTTVLVA